MLWFISDTHFSHTNIIKYSKRPFKDSQEMDDILIKNWNSKVKKQDLVYHLGDVGLGNPIRLKYILDELNGKIFLIKGNHEKSAMNKKCINRFEWVKDYFELNYFDNEDKKMQLMILFHYPMKTWNKKSYGSFHLFGHAHGNILPDNTLSMDVGVDCNNYYPISYFEIKNIMKNKLLNNIDKIY
jgi:calcineurin-like phosphoesterase family protein